MAMNIAKTIQSALAYFDKGDLTRAKHLVIKALKVQPGNVHLLNFSGVIDFGSGNFDSAIRNFRKAIQYDPQFSDAYFNLGNAFKEKGDDDEAIALYRKFLDLRPDSAGAYNNLGTIYQKRNNLDEAVSLYQKAISIDPDLVDAHYNLGNAFRETAQPGKAVPCYQEAIRLNPNFASAHNNLGSSFYETGRLREAIESFQKAIRIDPGLAGAYSNMGRVFQDIEEYDEAISYYQEAVRLAPDFAEAYNNLGSISKEKGQIEEAEAYFRQAGRTDPDNLLYSENLVFTMLYDPRCDAGAIYSEHLRLAGKYAGCPSPETRSHDDRKTRQPKLRIGYVSPDFRKHSVAYFIEPVLKAHDRSHFEIFCYSNVAVQDGVTERFRGHADKWRDIAGMSYESMAALVREDGIDILVDLAGHTEDNLMPLFACRPAPVQASWIGYPATTGLSAIDYKIVDGHTDPPGMTEKFYTERLMRLPETFLCYMPDEESPEVTDFPTLASGHITFGSFNNFAKVSPQTFDLWSDLLQMIPGSRLIMKAKGLSDKSVGKLLTGRFAAKGIDSERIELLPWKPSTKEHLEAYARIDIGLDTFPYNGTTTTCEALWMGVPVVTLSGDAHLSRVGLSLLSNVGLPELIAASGREYLDIGARLAGDTDKLQLLRKGLRDRMARSPLTDAKQFTVHIENSYNAMWSSRGA
jgi:protein O-GlcNAc transferase